MPGQATEQQGPHLLILRAGNRHFLIDLLEIELHLFELQPEGFDLWLERVLRLRLPCSPCPCRSLSRLSLPASASRWLPGLLYRLIRNSARLLKRRATTTTEMRAILDR